MRHRQGPTSEQRRVTQMDDWVQQNGPFTGHATASPSGWRFRFHTRMPRPCHSACTRQNILGDKILNFLYKQTNQYHLPRVGVGTIRTLDARQVRIPAQQRRLLEPLRRVAPHARWYSQVPLLVESSRPGGARSLGAIHGLLPANQLARVRVVELLAETSASLQQPRRLRSALHMPGAVQLTSRRSKRVIWCE